MATQEALKSARRFLSRLVDEGLPVQGLVVYGSYARGDAKTDSDIDVLVLLDDDLPAGAMRDLWTRLEHLTIGVDTRIETWPVTARRFEIDDVSPLIIAARSEGILVRDTDGPPQDKSR